MATLTLRPNAAGDLTEFTSQYPDSTYHWDKVDEASADDDTTYVYTTWASADLYALPNHTTESGTINFCKVYVRAKGVSSPDDYVYIRIKTEATLYTDTVKIGEGGVWETVSKQWNTNPKTGVAWTWAEIDALQIGMLATVGWDSVLVTQVYVEVDYTPPVAKKPTFRLDPKPRKRMSFYPSLKLG